MPTRRLPISDEGRLRALNAAKRKNDSIPLVDQFLTAQTKTRLDTQQPLFQTAMQKRSNALAEQGGSTALVNTAFTGGYNYISHFIQVFNFGIVRGKYPANHRAFYNLDISSDKLPVLRSEEDIATWGMRISEGDAARVAAGGVAMANPSAVEVAAALASFNTENTSQSGLKDAYDTAQEVVEVLREEADGVIKRVWNEVETFYSEETPASKRRNAREWGIVYLSDIELTFSFHITEITPEGSRGIVNAQIELVETGNDVQTDEAGRNQMKSKISDEATFKVTATGYQEKEVVVDLTTGAREFTVDVVLVKLP
jgi:hypothetical protein